MKRAIIFYNGNKSNLARAKEYIKKTDYIICADGGTKHALKLGIIPHTIIGDFDSLPNSIQKRLAGKNIEWVRFDKEKNETDSELAIRFAVTKRFTSLVLLGFSGTRLDHVFTNLLALHFIQSLGADGTIIEGNQELRLTNKDIHITGTIGDLISLVPFNQDVSGITTEGLQYELNNESLYFGYSRGISNVLIRQKAKITMTRGQLLLIHTRQKHNP